MQGISGILSHHESTKTPTGYREATETNRPPDSSEAGFVSIKRGHFILSLFQIRLQCFGVQVLERWHL